MTTKTYDVLFDGKCNENATSARVAVGAYVPGTVDLEEIVYQCASSDNDMLVSNKRYEVRTVTLPEWLSLEEWLRTNISWAFLWNDARIIELPEEFQRGLMKMSGDGLREACVTLLATKNFRSGFRLSLRNQLVEWLVTPEDKRAYRTPFSPRQIEKLVTARDGFNGKNRATRTYYAVRYNERTGLPVAA